jgi:hypothetical protein
MGVRYREYLGSIGYRRTGPKRRKSAQRGDVIDFNEVDDCIKRIAKALDEVSDEKERLRVNKKAGEFVKNAARAKAPRSTKPHYVYSTPKVSTGRRAKRGSATRYRTKYLPGNLQLSIRVLSLKRAIRAVIGPRILRKARAKVYGRNARNVNAFYAQMVYGSAKAFRDKVMLPALQQQEGRVRAYISKEIEALTKKAAKKHNLQ